MREAFGHDLDCALVVPLHRHNALHLHAREIGVIRSQRRLIRDIRERTSFCMRVASAMDAFRRFRSSR
jgi:hypothetical protein